MGAVPRSAAEEEFRFGSLRHRPQHPDHQPGRGRDGGDDPAARGNLLRPGDPRSGARADLPQGAVRPLEHAPGADGGFLVVDRAAHRRATAASPRRPISACPSRPSFLPAGWRCSRQTAREIFEPDVAAFFVGSGPAHRGEPADRPRDRTEGAAASLGALPLPPFELVAAAFRQQGRDADHEKAAGDEHADEEFGVAESRERAKESKKACMGPTSMQAFWQSGPERTRKRAFRKQLSGIEPEVHHVAVLHDVFLALQPQLAGIARAGLALERDVIRHRRWSRRG